MLDGAALRAAVEKHRPDAIIPEIEAIDTATLAALESEGWRVAPSAKAVQLTMNRDGIRDFAARELGLVTSRYRFAESARRGHRCCRRSRPAVRRQAGHVELGQGPDHCSQGRGGRRRLRLCGRQHARRPAPGHRRGTDRLRQRDHAADRRDPATASSSARRSATARRPATIAKAGSRRQSPTRRCILRATSRARWSRRSAATASSESSSS